MPEKASIALQGGQVHISRTCPHCGAQNKLTLPGSAIHGIRRWRAGEYIQVALPDLTAEQREALITGIHQRCWDEMFKEDDDG